MKAPAIVTATLLILAATTAFAQAQPVGVRYKRVTKINLGDVIVLGELKGPEVSFINHRAPTRFAPRLDIRGSFVPELLRSGDQL